MAAALRGLRREGVRERIVQRHREPSLHRRLPLGKQQGIGLIENICRVTVQLFVRGDRTVIAAAVQCDIEGVPKGSHVAKVRPAGRPGKESLRWRGT